MGEHKEVSHKREEKHVSGKRASHPMEKMAHIPWVYVALKP